MTSADSTVKFDDYEFKIPVGGSYNIYNALAAYSLSRFMGVDQEAIKTAFEKSPEIFGRQERVQIGDKEMVIIMVKNQIGVDTVLDMIKTDKDPFSFAFMLTALPADGEDTSWIWDCNFETLKEHDIPFKERNIFANPLLPGRRVELQGRRYPVQVWRFYRR